MYNKTIVVNDIAANPGGGLTVLKEFYDAVKRNKDEINWIFLLSEPYIEETDKIKVVLLPRIKKHVNRILFDSFAGARIINKFKPDIVFSLQNTIVYYCKGRTALYIHQPLPFQNKKKYSFLKKDEFGLACIQHLLGRRIIRSASSSDLCIVQTKWMEKAVEKKCKCRNIKQIYPNIPSIPNKAKYETTRTFFYPTSTISYKNNILLENVSKRLLQDGVHISTVFTTEEQDCISGVEHIGRIPMNEVYERLETSCLVFPSYIETFGYPLVEAKAIGSLILASDCEFSHELLDDYKNAYFFNPFDETDLYNLMKEVALGKIRRIDCTDRKNAASEQENAWDQVIEEILSLV